MSKNNPRPYKNSITNRNRNVSYNKKSNFKNDENVNNKEPDVTTRIRIDDDRLNDFDSLDTSFLEGRKSSALKKTKKEIEIENKRELQDKDSIFSKIILLKKFFFFLSLACLLLLAILFLFNQFNIVDKISNIGNIFKTSEKSNNKSKEIKRDKNLDEDIIDNNYLFVGDYYTDKFNFDGYDYHFVKSTDVNMTTTSLIEDINNKIFVYNPSIVFIQVGINDLNNGISSDDILSNYEKIIDQIKDNRSYAKIYIESIYPIDRNADDFDMDDRIDEDVNNKKIIEMNKKIKKLSEDKKVNYIDLYSVLSKNGTQLSDDYSIDGVYLNENGYKEIKNVIDKIIKG